MLQIVFKNIDRSELTQSVVNRKFQSLIKSFPDLNNHKMTLTLERLNSKFGVGKKLFGVKFYINGRKFKNLVLEKRAQNFYQAIGDLGQSLQENLHRQSEKFKLKYQSQNQIIYH
jgi:ribosome-associated translation inhibitor RaiA